MIKATIFVVGGPSAYLFMKVWAFLTEMGL